MLQQPTAHCDELKDIQACASDTRTPLVLLKRQENSTKPTRLLNGRRRSSSAPSCCRRDSMVQHRHSSKGFIQSHRWLLQGVCPTMPAVPHPALRSAARWSDRNMSSPCSSGFSYFPQCSGPGIPTRVQNVNCLVDSHELAAQLLPLHSLDALVGGLAPCVPILVRQR